MFLNSLRQTSRSFLLLLLAFGSCSKHHNGRNIYLKSNSITGSFEISRHDNGQFLDIVFVYIKNESIQEHYFRTLFAKNWFCAVQLATWLSDCNSLQCRITRCKMISIRAVELAIYLCLAKLLLLLLGKTSVVIFLDTVIRLSRCDKCQTQHDSSTL